jgi:hypothetical protein
MLKSHTQELSDNFAFNYGKEIKIFYLTENNIAKKTTKITFFFKISKLNQRV